MNNKKNENHLNNKVKQVMSFSSFKSGNKRNNWMGTFGCIQVYWVCEIEEKITSTHKVKSLKLGGYESFDDENEWKENDFCFVPKLAFKPYWVIESLKDEQNDDIGYKF